MEDNPVTTPPTPQQRISYVDPKDIDDPEMLEELARCAREGTPRPESQAIRAHVPDVFKVFAETWHKCFKNGVLDHEVKELCRVLVSRSVICEYCGNQRSVKGAKSGLSEDDYKDLLMFSKSDKYDERQKAALAYTEAIVWDLETDDTLWANLHANFTEPEIVELGYFVAMTMGQQRWLRTLNIDHHAVMPGTDASMAPGMETLEALKQSKASEEYWAKKKTGLRAAS